MTPSVYINLEDDVAKIVTRIKKEKSSELILVCPKRCFLFNDSINLRLLKKQIDLLKKTVHILTMDERGQSYAKEAGFGLKFLPKSSPVSKLSDISLTKKNLPSLEEKKEVSEITSGFTQAISKAVESVKKFGLEEEPEPDKEKAATTAKGSVARRDNLWGSLVGEQQPQQKLEIKDSFFPQEMDEAYRVQKKTKASRKLVWIFSVLSLVLIGAGAVFVLPKAEVTIFPKSEAISRDMEVTVSPSVKAPDSLKLVLPGVWFDEVVEVKKQLEAQGKKEVGNKASGTVRIYNFTRSPLNLKAGTTVLTAGSKKYVLSKDLQGVPIAKYKNTQTKEVDVNSLPDPVEVVAEEGGESSNLPAGTRLEITNQVFGSQPQFLYARTESGILGGTSRYLSQITEEDINRAKLLLEEQIVMSLGEKYKSQGLKFDPQAFGFEIVEFASDKAVGAQSPTFEAKLKARAFGLAYEPEQLNDMVYDRIRQTLSANKDLAPQDGNQLNFTVKSKETAQQIMILSVKFQSKAYSSLKDLSDLKKKMVLKKPDQVNDLIREVNSVERVDIQLAPAWQKYFPVLPSNIHIITSFQGT